MNNNAMTSPIAKPPNAGQVAAGVNPGRLRDYQTTVMILENISDAILILNQQGQIEYCNRSALEMLGSEFTACRGRHIGEILRLDEDETLSMDENAANGGIIEHLMRDIYGNFSARFITNNHTVPVVINLSPVLGKNQTIELYIMTAKNMSGRRLYENELKSVQASSISHTYLRSIRQLSIIIVHELSQPLAAFQMRMELLEQQLPEKFSPEISEINLLIDRMNKIVSRIRNYADQAEVTYRIPINIVEVIKNACRVFAYDFSEEKINVTITPSDQRIEVTLNSVSMEQVCVNLLSNALESFQELSRNRRVLPDEKKIDIFLRSEGEKWLEIYFDDNAAGISPKIRSRIFEPFFTTKNTDRNPGLGLTVVKNILNSLGGDIQLVEKKKRGTCIVIRLPLNQPREQDQLFNLIEMLHKK
jgi:PAS domain S-box-containing protein